MSPPLPTSSSYHQQLLSNGMDTHVFPTETPIVPTNIGMHPNYSAHNVLHYGTTNDDLLYNHHHQHQQQQYVERKNRRPLPRRHTVSTPYTTSVNNIVKGKEPMNENTDSNNTTLFSQQQQQQQPPPTKSRKSSLKAKRHRSLGKLDIYGSASSGTTSPPPIPDKASFDPLSAKLELWTHEQLLERVMELEKEKQVAQTTSMIKQQKGNFINTALFAFSKTMIR